MGTGAIHAILPDVRRQFIYWFVCMKKHLLASLLIASFLAAPLTSRAADFDPAYIISDPEILDYNSMNLADITAFINRQGGAIKDYIITEKDGLPPESGKTQMTVAEAIYDRAVVNKVNPKFLLVLLQKEQSLLTETEPTARQLDWAAGYGCPDGGGCNDRWRGLWKQINSASLQFRSYMDEPQLYKYKAGETYVFTNPYGTISQAEMTVTVANQATAALYNYTPHVYNGNYNFWKLWNRFFTRSFPDGSLVQAQGEVGVWLIQNGTKRPFTSRGALVSRYDPKRIITIGKSDLDAYPTGTPIKFALYTIVRTPAGDLYLLLDSTKRKIASPEVFRKIGFNPEEVESASNDDIASYQDSKPVTLEDAYPTGALLRDPATGGVYYVIDGTKAPLTHQVFLKTMFKNTAIIKATAEQLADFEKVAPVKFSDGYLLKGDFGPGVYVISNGQKRPVASGEVFESLGYKWENIITVPGKVLDMYPLGEMLTKEWINPGA